MDIVIDREKLRFIVKEIDGAVKNVKEENIDELCFCVSLGSLCKAIDDMLDSGTDEQIFLWIANLLLAVLPVVTSHPSAFALMVLGVKDNVISSPYHDGLRKALIRVKNAMNEFYDDDTGSIVDQGDFAKKVTFVFLHIPFAYYLYPGAPNIAMSYLHGVIGALSILGLDNALNEIVSAVGE